MKKALIHILSNIFNRYFDIYTGGRKRPVFFNVNETCPELRIFDDNYDLIKSEVDSLLSSKKLRKYHDIDSLQHKISAVQNPGKSWKVFMLYMMGDFSDEAIDACPTTCSFLKQIPSIYQCFFSILDPQKNIPSHSGSYRGYLRYHLGLKSARADHPLVDDTSLSSVLLHDACALVKHVPAKGLSCLS